MSKVLNKIKVCVDEGNYYEAHQMLVSVSQRLSKQKKDAEALDLLQEGVLTMLNAKESASALDLAERLIICLGNESSEEAKDRLLSLFCEFPIRESCCDEFVKMICKWSASCDPEYLMGDPILHHAFGIRYYKEILNYEAEAHLVCGTLESAKLLSRLHFRWYKSQKTISDPGYFLARIILQYIALGKIEHAIVALDMFLDLVILEDPKIVKLNQLPDRAIVISSSTWMTLCQLMVVTVQRGSRSHFKSLLNQFDKELSFDAFLKDMVYNHIGSKYFDMGPKKVANPLQDMMKNLFMPHQNISKTLADTDMD